MELTPIEQTSLIRICGDGEMWYRGMVPPEDILVDIHNVLSPKALPDAIGARVIVFDKTPIADRSLEREEKEDKLRVKLYRREKVTKALSGGIWTTFSSLGRRTGMGHMQLLATLRDLDRLGRVEMWEGPRVSKWRLKA